MTTPSLPPERPLIAGLRRIAPMILGTAILCAGNGFLSTLVALSVIHGDFDKSAVQIVVTGYPVGFLLGCLGARFLIMRLGHPLAFAALALLTALATIGFVLPYHLWVWAALRVVNGLCMAASFTIVESWVNLNAGLRDRGALIASYMVATSLGLSLGQAMLNLGSIGGSPLFWVAILTLSLSPAPLLLGGFKPRRESDGTTAVHYPVRLRDFVVIAPLAILAAGQAGMTNLNFLTVAPIYGAMIGLKPAQAGSLIVAFSLGGLCVQPLIGWLSDKFDRRIILGLMAGLSASLCAVIFVTGGPPLWLLLAILFVYGACTLAIYPVALALAFSKVDPALVVSVSGKFLLVYSIGSILAPSISTELMERFQPQAMFVFLGMLAATVACCSVIAILTVADPRAAQKARTSMP